MQGCERVYHAAALVSFTAKDVKKMLDINVQGTSNVVNVALSQNIKKLGYVSSIAALSRYEDNDEVTEENYWKPNAKNLITLLVNTFLNKKYGAESKKDFLQ